MRSSVKVARFGDLLRIFLQFQLFLTSRKDPGGYFEYSMLAASTVRHISSRSHKKYNLHAFTNNIGKKHFLSAHHFFLHVRDQILLLLFLSPLLLHPNLLGKLAQEVGDGQTRDKSKSLFLPAE